MAFAKPRKVGFWEAVLAVYGLGVTLGSLFATIGFQVPFPAAVKWSAIVCAVLAGLYLVSAGVDRVTTFWMNIGKTKRRKSTRRSKSKSNSSKPEIPRGLVRKLERRAEQQIKHQAAQLARKRTQACMAEDLCGVDDAKWRQEQDSFIEAVVLKSVDSAIRAALKRRRGLMSSWRRKMNQAADHADREKARTGVGLDFRPGMDGFEYEAFCARILDEAGWEVPNRRDSGDQGVDLIARRGRDEVVAIQCKRYRTAIGNSAVQEIFAGKTTVAPHAFAAVVTNSTYTKSAKELALATGVFLLHHDDLHRMVDIIRAGETVPQAA